MSPVSKIYFQQNPNPPKSDSGINFAASVTNQFKPTNTLQSALNLGTTDLKLPRLQSTQVAEAAPTQAEALRAKLNQEMTVPSTPTVDNAATRWATGEVQGVVDLVTSVWNLPGTASAAAEKIASGSVDVHALNAKWRGRKQDAVAQVTPENIMSALKDMGWGTSMGAAASIALFFLGKKKVSGGAGGLTRVLDDVAKSGGKTNTSRKAGVAERRNNPDETDTFRNYVSAQRRERDHTVRELEKNYGHLPPGAPQRSQLDKLRADIKFEEQVAADGLRMEQLRRQLIFDPRNRAARLELNALENTYSHVPNR